MSSEAHGKLPAIAGESGLRCDVFEPNPWRRRLFGGSAAPGAKLEDGKRNCECQE